MKYLFFLLALTVFFSCESAIKFSEPQPLGSENKEIFPFSYQGDYLCTEDSTVLKVRERHIYEEQAILMVDVVDGSGPDSMITTRALMTENGLEEQYFFGDEPLPLEDVIFTDEMFIGMLIHRDTLFTIGADQRLRYYRGHLILNFYRDDLDWDVVLLTRETNGDVTLSMTKKPEDLEAVRKITPVTELITRNGDEQILLNPTKGEFGKLLNKKLLFESCAYYERLPDYDWTNKFFQ